MGTSSTVILPIQEVNTIIVQWYNNDYNRTTTVRYTPCVYKQMKEKHNLDAID